MINIALAVIADSHAEAEKAELADLKKKKRDKLYKLYIKIDADDSGKRRNCSLLLATFHLLLSTSTFHFVSWTFHLTRRNLLAIRLRQLGGVKDGAAGRGSVCWHCQGREGGGRDHPSRRKYTSNPLRCS